MAKCQSGHTMCISVQWWHLENILQLFNYAYLQHNNTGCLLKLQLIITLLTQLKKLVAKNVFCLPSDNWCVVYILQHDRRASLTTNKWSLKVGCFVTDCENLWACGTVWWLLSLAIRAGFSGATGWRCTASP